MKKQLLLMLLALLPLMASADDSGSCGTNVTYTYVESSRTLTISGNGQWMIIIGTTLLGIVIRQR